ncbi:hypothetical protein A3K80_04355 [Candidatus Bathyarchaeota archaeon RBG_13_38_9]|nr:MAG: hypothetical protein A3K80_04355 [Candidatus Bathyarchaeota archaeon RBG_13_38_9]
MDTYRGVIQQNDISLEELEFFQRRALREFYLRPKIVLNLLTKMKLRNIKTSAKWVAARLARST